MRRVFAVFCVVAISAAAASAARADGLVATSLPAWDNTAYFFFSSLNHVDGSGTPKSVIFLGSTSTPCAQDVNMSVYWRATSASTSYLIGTILLNDNTDLSGGLTQTSEYNSADGNVTWLMPAFGGTNPAGTFQSWDGTAWPADSGGNGSQRYAHSSYEIASGGEFYLPGSAAYYPSNTGGFQFDVQAWTGDHASYAAAQSDHTGWAGDTGWFAASGVNYINEAAAPGDMWAHAPNLVLTHPVPEPSTMLLTVVGLIGALACAARNRR